MFEPTHLVPERGLATWDAPDPSAPAGPRLTAGLELEEVDRRGDWAQVRCSNGWTCWVDARQVAPVAAVERVLVPAGGLRAWAEPNGTVEPAAHLEGGLPVDVAERRGAWARVVCANGWAAWVDGRLLDGHPARARAATTATAATARGARAVSAVPTWALVGAGLVVLGWFLPWMTAGGQSANAWDLTVAGLLRRSGDPNGLKVGLLLLPVVLVALPWLNHRPLPPWALLVLGGLATNPAALTLFRIVRDDLGVSPGIGLFATLVGGCLFGVDYVRVRNAT